MKKLYLILGLAGIASGAFANTTYSLQVTNNTPCPLVVNGINLASQSQQTVAASNLPVPIVEYQSEAGYSNCKWKVGTANVTLTAEQANPQATDLSFTAGTVANTALPMTYAYSYNNGSASGSVTTGNASTVIFPNVPMNNALSLTVTSAATPVPPQGSPGGAWLNSCNVTTSLYQNGVLSASCKDSGGFSVGSELNVAQVCNSGSTVSVNSGGYLQCDSVSPSALQYFGANSIPSSCSLEASSLNNVSTVCQDDTGSWNASGISPTSCEGYAEAENKVTVANSSLACYIPPDVKILGSYTSICSNIYFDGKTLTATCNADKVQLNYTNLCAANSTVSYLPSGYGSGLGGKGGDYSLTCDTYDPRVQNMLNANSNTHNSENPFLVTGGSACVIRYIDLYGGNHSSWWSQMSYIHATCNGYKTQNWNTTVEDPGHCKDDDGNTTGLMLSDWAGHLDCSNSPTLNLKRTQTSHSMINKTAAKPTTQTGIIPWMKGWLN